VADAWTPQSSATAPSRVDDGAPVDRSSAAPTSDSKTKPPNAQASGHGQPHSAPDPSAPPAAQSSEHVSPLPAGDDSGKARFHQRREVAGFGEPTPGFQPPEAGETWNALDDPTTPTLTPHAYGDSIETQVGGVFYLLNLALSLDLYADFTKPLQPGIALSLWDFLTLVGQRLTPLRFRRDPLWGLLANLAGRAPAQAPGAGFHPPYAWRVPAAWLSAFPKSATWRCSESPDRLRVMHSAGFAVVDVPRTSRVSSTTTARWMRWLMPYVCARLSLALGETDRRKAGSIVCAQNARVFTSPTHLDVMFSLAELPIAVRRSGLDRNPGWVPSAGRVMTFHYE
jgi:hypothetical protein